MKKKYLQHPFHAALFYRDVQFRILDLVEMIRNLKIRMNLMRMLQIQMLQWMNQLMIRQMQALRQIFLI